MEIDGTFLFMLAQTEADLCTHPDSSRLFPSSSRPPCSMISMAIDPLPLEVRRISWEKIAFPFAGLGTNCAMRDDTDAICMSDWTRVTSADDWP